MCVLACTILPELDVMIIVLIAFVALHRVKYARMRVFPDLYFPI